MSGPRSATLLSRRDRARPPDLGLRGIKLGPIYQERHRDPLTEPSLSAADRLGLPL